MRPVKKYKSRNRKGNKNKCSVKHKSNSLNINVASKVVVEKQGKPKSIKQHNQQNETPTEVGDVESLFDITSYRIFIADLCNKVLNDPNKCDSYTEPLFLIANKKGGGEEQTKASAANLSIKSIGILLSHLPTSGPDEESQKAKQVLDKFSKILANKINKNPLLVGFIVPKIISSDFRSSNDTLLTLCLICCNRSIYKYQSVESTDYVNNCIDENLKVIRWTFQHGALLDCIRLIKLINGLKKYGMNPQVISLISLINFRAKEFTAQADFKFQFNKVSKDTREKLKHFAINETPDMVAKNKKVLLKQILSLYFKILESNRVKSCELLIACFNGLGIFSQFLATDIQRDILQQIRNYQTRQTCPLVTIESLDSAMKIMKYSQSSLKNADISWIFDSLLEMKLTDLPFNNYEEHSFSNNKGAGCKEKLIKSLCLIIDHLGYFINPSCDIQNLTLLISQLLSFSMLCDQTSAKTLVEVAFNLVKKIPQLKDIFDKQGVLVSSLGKWESCFWHITALKCHYSSEIRDFLADQLVKLH